MRKIKWVLIALLLAAFFAGNTSAQEFMIYPAEGQSEDQLERDKFECYSWAKNQTGFDPMQIPKTSAPPPEKQAKRGGAGRGAVAGGATGAIIGGIAGGSKGARRGALIGGGSGAVIGGMRRSNQRKQEEQARQQWEREQTNAICRSATSTTALIPHASKAEVTL